MHPAFVSAQIEHHVVDARVGRPAGKPVLLRRLPLNLDQEVADFAGFNVSQFDKTIDAAANTAKNIGFRRIEVDLSSL